MPATLVIDMRCLQDRRYAERGIGNHARNAVLTAPAPFIGVIDPNLPALPPELAARAEVLSPHGYVPGAKFFLNPSPMSPDQLFIGRLLRDPHVTKAALVYDFIPYDDQKNYLAHPVTRLDYFASLAWLKDYDFFCPISADTENRLRRLYGAVRSQVTGVALPAWAQNIASGTQKHILMIGGEDARKNPEILLHAHASSNILKNVALVITGQYPPQTAEKFRAISGVELPGRVPTEDLRRLYAQAICVVVPSRAEGFSMPVIEAAAARTPAIVSDILAHRELVPAPEFRFAHDDAERLRDILEALVTTPLLRGHIIAAQSGLAEAFAPAAVGAKLWSFVDRPARCAIARKKPRLALLTPMPPTKSGIADFSAAWLAVLAPVADVTVFSCGPVTALPYLSGKYDRVVSVIGNSPVHQASYDLAVRCGSAAICHDARLLGLATTRGLEHAATLAAKELHRPVAPTEIAAWAADERLREASFLQEIAIAARPLVFHARQPVSFVQKHFGVTARYLPFPVYRPFARHITAAQRQAARDALGVPPGQKIIVSFGFINRNKGVVAAIQAFFRLARKDARLIFLGEATPDLAEFQMLAVQLGLAEHVRFLGDYVSEQNYRTHLLAADCGLQLREGGAGNISGTLQDCIAAGLPSVANQDLAENLSAASYVKRVSDTLDSAEIATALGAVLSARADTEAERQAYCAQFSMENYVANFFEAVFS